MSPTGLNNRIDSVKNGLKGEGNRGEGVMKVV